jgi:hypothetical protein
MFGHGDEDHSTEGPRQLVTIKHQQINYPEIFIVPTLTAKLGFHKSVQVAVEHRVDIARFVIAPMILHELIGRLHVTADL